LTIHWNDIARISWSDTDPEAVRIRTSDGGKLSFRLPQFSGYLLEERLAHKLAAATPPAELWAFEIRLRTGLSWGNAGAESSYIRHAQPFYSFNQKTGDKWHEMLDSAYGPARLIDKVGDRVVVMKPRKPIFRLFRSFKFLYLSYGCTISLRNRAILLFPAEDSPRTTRILPVAAIVSAVLLEDCCLLLSTSSLSFTFEFGSLERRELWYSILNSKTKIHSGAEDSGPETTVPTPLEAPKLPPNLGKHIEISPYPVANGGFATVYEGWYKPRSGVSEVSGPSRK
jgi:hypothetical protein